MGNYIKFKIMSMALCLFAVHTACMGQKPLRLRDLINQQNRELAGKSNVVYKAVESELFVIRQQYRLKRQGQTYGRNGKPYYGESYSLGIKVSNGMYVLGDVMEPWTDDADYRRINAENKYEPELFWSYKRGMADSTYTTVELEQGTEYIYAVHGNKRLFFHEDKRSDFGLAVDLKAGKKEGFMIWACAAPSVKDSAMTVTLRPEAYTTVADGDSTLRDMSPSEPDKLLGGLFVVPRYERGGKVQLMLVGVAFRKAPKSWALQLLAVGGDKADSGEGGDKAVGGVQKNGNAASAADSADPTPVKNPAPAASGGKKKKGKQK